MACDPSFKGMTQALPSNLPLFPLGGAILLPGETLPLNVFEPRYLNMVDDALRGDRLIGIIQTQDGGSPEKPRLAGIGGAGRISSHSETPDGRYMIVLDGVSRFHLLGEEDHSTPYRVGRVDFEPFADDCGIPDAMLGADRDLLLSRARAWFAHESIEADWTQIESVSTAHLVDRLAMAAPFSAPEKQSLLESRNGRDRLRAMTDILKKRIAAAEGGNVN